MESAGNIGNWYIMEQKEATVDRSTKNKNSEKNNVKGLLLEFLLLALKKLKHCAMSPCHQPFVALGQKMFEMALRETVGTICPREGGRR